MIFLLNWMCVNMFMKTCRNLCMKTCQKSCQKGCQKTCFSCTASGTSPYFSMAIISCALFRALFRAPFRALFRALFRAPFRALLRALFRAPPPHASPWPSSEADNSLQIKKNRAKNFMRLLCMPVEPEAWHTVDQGDHSCLKRKYQVP